MKHISPGAQRFAAVGLLVAAVLTVWSMFYYMQKAWPLIKEKAGPAL